MPTTQPIGMPTSVETATLSVVHYDVAIIGAGMSGLAAGIRLAYFDRRVLIVEKHYAFGGLNSYYTLNGREFDVGLHAVTNYVGPEVRSAPLPKLLRQLRLSRNDFDLHPQRFSEVRFPGRRLRFSNDIAVLTEEVAREFPGDADNFRRLTSTIEAYDDVNLGAVRRSARGVLRERLRDPVLIDMLLCPLMFYGSAEEHDMDFTQFATMFKSVFLEGFARPRRGVRTIIKALVRKFRACGGKLRMRCGVERIETDRGSVTSLALEAGETLTADTVLSCAGYAETMRLCGGEYAESAASDVGRVSFVETIAVLDRPPARLGHDAAIVFENDADTFAYAVPDGLIDRRSAIACCPNNYEGHDDLEEGALRLTWLANSAMWARLSQDAYRAAKVQCREAAAAVGERLVPGLGEHVIGTDVFTPRTIQRFTGHLNGAVYGSPRKRRDGRTPLRNLFICGTDQGFLGIIGAMLSGITIANLQVLGRE